jgi:SNF2 family DNA or RNA helicase
MDERLGALKNLGELRKFVDTQNVNDDLSDGNTILMYAAFDGPLSIVRFLLSIGADTKIVNDSGNTVLTYSSYRNDLLVTKTLVEAGAEITNSHVSVCIDKSSLEVFTYFLLKKSPFSLENLVSIIDGEMNDFLKVVVKNVRLSAIDWTPIMPKMKQSTRSLLTGESFYKSQELAGDYELYDYQVEADLWMEEKENIRKDPLDYGMKGGIIMFEMGLGKTLLALYHTFRMQQERGEVFPTLVVSSKSIMFEWKAQGIEKFYPGAKVFFYHKEISPGCDSVSGKFLRSHTIVFTTYDMITQFYKTVGEAIDGEYTIRGEPNAKTGIRPVLQINTRPRPTFDGYLFGPEAMYNMPWERVICDESQKFANPKTKIYHAIMGVYGKWKFCLTGTPIRNFDLDIWAQLRFCGYTGLERTRGWDQELFDEHKLKRFILVKNYQDVGVVIPDKIEHEYKVAMTMNQAKFYVAFLEKMDSLFDEMASVVGGMMAILAVFTRLRQICIAPSIILSKTQKVDTGDETLREIVQNMDGEIAEWLVDKKGDSGWLSPKVLKSVEIIRSIPSDEKIIVFSMFVSCLDVIEESLHYHSPEIKTVHIDGSVSGKERHKQLEIFKQDPSVRVLFIQGKTGSEGLNITVANHILLVENWWNNATSEQSIARAWRRGQDKPVNVYRIMTSDTIEEQIQIMCENKSSMAGSYLHGTVRDVKPVSLGKYDLQKMIKVAMRIHSTKQ